MAEPTPLDLRHLAPVLDQGRQAADRRGDASLSYVLTFMVEAAVGYHQHTGGSVWNAEEDFARLAKRIGL